MLAFALQSRSPIALLIAGVLSALALAVLIARRRLLPRATVICFAIALLALALSAGDLLCRLPRSPKVTVMVDLSPSTRSASYRDRAALNARLASLLGSRDFSLLAFGDANGPLPSGDQLTDLPVQRTVFAPRTDADAIVLLSDGRFTVPAAAPPTFPVIDAGLIDPPDAAVVDARLNTGYADITVAAHGEPRTLSYDRGPVVNVMPGQANGFRFAANASKEWVHTASLNPGDAWPENDALQFGVPPFNQRPRWWVSSTKSPAWTSFSPGELPNDPTQYLSPSVIVLDGVSPDSLSPAVERNLQQYVRDLGGSLLIIGNWPLFRDGAFNGTVLGDLSPLASNPPTATTHWLLLTDGSGSMATDAGGTTRWQAATTALSGLIREIPPADTVSIGSFAADLRWWFEGMPAKDAEQRQLPPANVSPSGPTNLQPVLEKLVASLDGSNSQLVLLTDGETAIAQPDTLAAAMTAKHLKLNVLAIGSGQALTALKSIVDATGGHYAAEQEIANWRVGARNLFRTAQPKRFVQGDRQTAYLGPLSSVPPRRHNSLTVTWPKSGAELLAAAEYDKGTIPVIARQPLGAGQVAASVAPLDSQELDAVVNLIAAWPVDPRYRVDWESAARGKLTVDATDPATHRPLNDLNFSLNLRAAQADASPQELTLMQTAPGRYEVELPPSEQPRSGRVFLEKQEVDRRTIAGRYAHEFDAIGLDSAALKSLAERTGGRVIEPTQKTPIDFPLVWREASPTPWLAMVGATLIAIGLVLWKRSGFVGVDRFSGVPTDQTLVSR